MYYLLIDQFSGNLMEFGVEFGGEIPSGYQLIKREGGMPDLDKYYWHAGSLAFVEKNSSRIMSKLAFMRRFTSVERVAIYSAEKNDINVSVFLDMFRLSQEINLDDPDLIQGVQLFELAGIIGPGRSTEVLA